MKKEVWFKKIMWSYIPCNWKGWAFIFALVSCFILSAGTMAIFIGLIGREDLDYLAFMPIVPLVVIGLIVAERHS